MRGALLGIKRAAVKQGGDFFMAVIRDGWRGGEKSQGKAIWAYGKFIRLKRNVCQTQGVAIVQIKSGTHSGPWT
ncbi:hypothetical protein RXV86_09555 [Alisedimentitalea sp. MJ-SS2]|uniref:hypothetical protein n=1 Tax=Aliisedimentitalea sp. MJ-SS2 TaxID=3049795 RepID=UPI0029076E3D|nr:hypothetical protein [Alisedimentitalea sp. MJ-SS2]MDU8927629.1 hypothetical protein [Alisedimentitalea sp. MJ-SS2]